MIRLAVSGARGRMGSLICSLAQADSQYEIALQINREDPHQNSALKEYSIDAIVDFSCNTGTKRVADLAARRQVALLVGTTALTDETIASLNRAAEVAPVMIASNTSLGVAALRKLAVEAAKIFGKNFSIDLVEIHHSAKKDAPSGTALTLVDALRDKANADITPERIHSIRAGDIVGQHEILFAGPGETLRLIHSATSRELFAHGALRAIDWLHSQPVGRYEIEDMLEHHA